MLRKSWFILFCLPLFTFAQLNEADVISRLALVQNQVPLDYSMQSRPFVQEYVSNYANRTGKMLERFNGIDKDLIEVFNANKVPIELRYACISFSNCENSFTESSGREGIYMLDYNVAQKHGLYISNFVDERRDPIKAAIAFCAEMNALFAKSSDWKTALTQYASGQLEWQKAAGRASDSLQQFEAIAAHLPYNYKMVYSKYLAAVYIANYYKQHNISGNGLTIKKELVPIGQYATLFHLSEKLEMEYNLLKELNPIYKKGIIPNSGRNYYLVLPVKKVNKFYELGEDVYDLPQITEVAAVEEQGNKELEKPTISTEVVKQELPIQVKKEVSGKRTIIYVVRKGDAISIIADYYDCYVSDIKRWNGLRSTRINYGQRLKIVIPASKYDYYIRINKMSSAELNRIRNKD